MSLCVRFLFVVLPFSWTVEAQRKAMLLKLSLRSSCGRAPSKANVPNGRLAVSTRSDVSSKWDMTVPSETLNPMEAVARAAPAGPVMPSVTGSDARAVALSISEAVLARVATSL